MYKHLDGYYIETAQEGIKTSYFIILLVSKWKSKNFLLLKSDLYIEIISFV